MDPITTRGYLYHNWTVGDGDTLVRTGRTRVRSITICKPATTAGVVTIRDGINATGAIVLPIKFEIPGGPSDFQPITLGPLDLNFETGLFIDTDGTVLAVDFTIAYAAT